MPSKIHNDDQVDQLLFLIVRFPAHEHVKRALRQ